MSQFGNGVSFAGYSGWRMPTIDELRSLVWCSNGVPREEAWDNYCSGNGGKAGEYQRPTIDLKAFPNTAANWFWSSTLAEENAFVAWDLDFDNGDDVWGLRGYGGAHVRLVRFGQ